MLRPVDWVLEHSTSIWCGVIRDRIAAGVGPEPMARVFLIEADVFAEVRFADHRANLVLPVCLCPVSGGAR